MRISDWSSDVCSSDLAAARPALATCWRFDEVLATIVQTTSEPLIGQMRLTWWHEAIAALETGPAPAEPLLQDIAVILPVQGLSSEERRVGKECVSTCNARWWQDT